jgi:hypothetical protein
LFPQKVSKCGLEQSFDHILTAASLPHYLIATNDASVATRRIDGLDTERLAPRRRWAVRCHVVEASLATQTAEHLAARVRRAERSARLPDARGSLRPEPEVSASCP